MRQDDEWSTVQTVPSLNLLRACFSPKHIDVVTCHEPPWKVGEHVSLVLMPYGADAKSSAGRGTGARGMEGLVPESRCRSPVDLKR